MYKIFIVPSYTTWKEWCACMLDQLLHQKRTHRRTKQYFEVAPNKLFSTLQVIASFLSCAMCLKHSCVTLISQVANCF